MPHPIEPCPCGSLKLYKDCCGRLKQRCIDSENQTFEANEPLLKRVSLDFVRTLNARPSAPIELAFGYGFEFINGKSRHVELPPQC
jgi:hypothetical protein